MGMRLGLPSWKWELDYQHGNGTCTTIMGIRLVIPSHLACWLCCFLQTQSIHQWRPPWSCALDVFSRIPSIKGNKWTCIMLWRRQGFLHVGMLLLRWTQSFPWSWGDNQQKWCSIIILYNAHPVRGKVIALSVGVFVSLFVWLLWTHKWAVLAN